MYIHPQVWYGLYAGTIRLEYSVKTIFWRPVTEPDAGLRKSKHGVYLSFVSALLVDSEREGDYLQSLSFAIVLFSNSLNYHEASLICDALEFSKSLVYLSNLAL